VRSSVKAHVAQQRDAEIKTENPAEAGFSVSAKR